MFNKVKQKHEAVLLNLEKEEIYINTTECFAIDFYR